MLLQTLASIPLGALTSISRTPTRTRPRTRTRRDSPLSTNLFKVARSPVVEKDSLLLVALGRRLYGSRVL